VAHGIELAIENHPAMTIGTRRPRRAPQELGLAAELMTCPHLFASPPESGNVSGVIVQWLWDKLERRYRPHHRLSSRACCRPARHCARLKARQCEAPREARRLEGWQPARQRRKLKSPPRR